MHMKGVYYKLKNTYLADDSLRFLTRINIEAHLLPTLICLPSKRATLGSQVFH